MRAYNSWLRASKRHPIDPPHPRRVDPITGIEPTPKLPHGTTSLPATKPATRVR
ncbi:hypothetical protein ACUHMQ_17635 [Chitinimonas sp. PSY-7]|uniref:hypothetical protein n=1 Tax=Chitinimonas sp. PSY-7 TaxID=3459088 RepID=UPI00403FFCDF